MPPLQVRVDHPDISYSDLWILACEQPPCLPLTMWCRTSSALLRWNCLTGLCLAADTCRGCDYRSGYEAVEALGGPHIEMTWGRVDATEDQVDTDTFLHL